MKGFGARERNGLIVFCCFVIFFLAIGPVADRLGCTSRHVTPLAGDEIHVPIDSQIDSTASQTDDSLSIEFSHQEKSSVNCDTSVRKKRRHKAGLRNTKTPNPERRNYLDEPL